MSRDDGPDDSALVAAAAAGEAAAFAALFERHRAGMRAVAIGLLGWGADADDAVQDAMLLALRRLGELRDPAAAGPWLRAVTRNVSRMRVRTASREDPSDVVGADLAATGPTPEEVLERHALRDWVWSALDELPEPLQTAVMLRYFSSAATYEQIAAVCDVPVGTVRSRLHDARRRLVHRLQASAGDRHGDTAALVARRRRDAEDLLDSYARGEIRAGLAHAAEPDLELTGPQGQRGRGRASLAQIMESDLAAGVGQRLVDVTASRRLTLLECDLISPSDDPEHCPPGVLWLMRVRDGRADRVRLFHPSGAGPALVADMTGH